MVRGIAVSLVLHVSVYTVHPVSQVSWHRPGKPVKGPVFLQYFEVRKCDDIAFTYRENRGCIKRRVAPPFFQTCHPP